MNNDYEDALNKMKTIFAEAKQKVIEECRPVVFKCFSAFFAANPEVESLNFRIITDDYDDENYYDNVERIHYKLKPEYLPDDYEYDDDSEYSFDYGPLRSPCQVTRDRADGKFDLYMTKSFSAIELEKVKNEAIKTIADSETIINNIGNDRVQILTMNLRYMQNFIKGIDMEFYKVVLGEDVSVIVTKEGFNVE